MLGSIPGLYPLDASSIPPVLTIKNFTLPNVPAVNHQWLRTTDRERGCRSRASKRTLETSRLAATLGSIHRELKGTKRKEGVWWFHVKTWEIQFLAHKKPTDVSNSYIKKSFPPPLVRIKFFSSDPFPLDQGISMEFQKHKPRTTDCPQKKILYLFGESGSYPN